MPVVATLVAALMLANAPATPAEQLSAAAKSVSFTTYVPDSVALGYSLTRVSVAEIKGHKVIHAVYTHQSHQNSFDLVMSPAGKLSRADLLGNKLEITASEDDTVVMVKRGKTDLLLVSPLMSDPSAKRLLERAKAL